MAVVILVMLYAGAPGSPAASAARNGLVVLCYHDIPKRVNLDDYGVDRESFVQQIEYLRTHGYRFVSLDDVLRANKGGEPLPEKAVLLTFDDGYASFYEFVYPLLRLYRYPSVIAVVTGWVERGAPGDVRHRLMTWEQLREVAQSGLVEVASHTHDHHRTVVYNPQGNDGWAVVSRICDPLTRTYETESAYRKRIYEDFLRSRTLIEEKTGIAPRVIVWPFGKYSRLSIREARRAGFEATVCLEDTIASANNVDDIARYMLVKNPPIKEFIKAIKANFAETVRQRALQADLDLIYDPDPDRQEKNLDAFIDRVIELGVNTVYLQAFCDDQGNGNISSVYFPNRVLPMKADLFNRVANQLSIRDIQVFAWMPMLSIVLPDAEENERLRVREFAGGKKRLSTSWYERLSPFSREAAGKLETLYGDLAANARIDGVIFQDDGYLNDFEDFHPDACKEYRKISGDDSIPYQELGSPQKERWTRAKTARLIELTRRLQKAVRTYRPRAVFARTFYAPVLTDPESEEWLAQNYAESLAAYDYVVVMAYPAMEDVPRPPEWFRTLVNEVRKHPGGIEKTVFKVQAYDWKKKRWIDTKTIDEWLRTLVAAGARHIAYYPDNYLENRPVNRIIKTMISARDFPFERGGR